MTLRAVIVGVLAGLVIAGGGYINDRVLNLESVVAGHLLPVIVLGLLLVAMIVVVPALFRIRRALAPRPSETATVLLLALVACSIPGRGLMEQFTSVIGMPGHWYAQNPGWQKSRLFEYIPPAMVLAPDDPTRDAFINGLGDQGATISLAAVPWANWIDPLTIWLPMVVLTALAMVCLSLIVHRQWSRHELLRYPIAEFMTSLIRRPPDRPAARLYADRLFWIGLTAVLVVRCINGLHAWFPEHMPQIPMYLDFSVLRGYWPCNSGAPWYSAWLRPQIFPIVIGFAFFLGSDVALSLGLTQVLFLPIAAVFVTCGVNMHSSYMAGGAMGWHRSGAYVALALMLLYLGRSYYRGVFLSALTFRRRPGVPAYAAWACRILIAALTALTAIMIRLGLDWTVAVMTVALIMIVFLGVSRISAESGLFFIQSRWMPLGVLLGLMGGFALGPQELIICGLLCSVLCLDPSMALMPHLVNALRLCENVGVRPARAAWASTGMYVAGLAVAVVVVLWANYNYGVPKYGWSYYRVPTMALRPAAGQVDVLREDLRLAESESLTPLTRLLRIEPQAKYLWAAGSGFALVLVCSALRLRYPWWPLHPIVFLVWATWPLWAFSFSFLIGWAIKSAVTKIGGQGACRRTRPLMIGAIAGDLLAAMLFMVHGGVYYLATDTMPTAYRYFPR